MDEIIIKTDWWMFFATIFAGCISAFATAFAVIYTNKKTRERLEEQQQRFDIQKEEEFKREKFVIINPMLLCATCTGLLDRIIVSNNFQRTLLLSGLDGFDFFEKKENAGIDKYRMIQFDNPSNNNIYNIQIDTNSILVNTESKETFQYQTYNGIYFLRSKESFILRLIDKKQFDLIISLRKKGILTGLRFECRITYSTEAKQRITYSFIIEIKNEYQINYIEDGVIKTVDEKENTEIRLTPFKNLQDYANNLDRAVFVYQKMASTMQEKMGNKS